MQNLQYESWTTGRSPRLSNFAVFACVFSIVTCPILLRFTLPARAWFAIGEITRLGFAVFLVLNVAGAVFGVIAVHRVERSGGILMGWSLALIGTLLSFFSIIVDCIFMVLIWNFLHLSPR